MSPGDRPMHRAAFRALLRLYPAWFRARHGAEMEQLFLARLARAEHVPAVAALWVRVLADAIATIAALYRRRGGPSARPRRGGLHMWSQDLRFALRQLSRTPVFTVGAILLLAVGLGANIAVFTVMDAFLLRGLPYARPAEVVQIYQDNDDGTLGSSVAFPAYRDIAATGVFRAVSAAAPAQLDWDRDGGVLGLSVEFATASYLEVAGLSMHRGRWFSPHHDNVGSEPVAVVSAPAWRAKFGADPGIIGRTIRLNGQPATIIGVGPNGLSGSFDPVVTDLWLSISASAIGGQYRVGNLEQREDHWYQVRARLARGVTPDAAQSAMNVLAARLGEAYPNIDRGRDITVERAADVELFPQTQSTLSLAGALVVTLLLLACANLANLLLVRGLGRADEVALRRALGAGGASIIRLFLIESVGLSVAGGLAGLALAQAALGALPSTPLPAPFSATLDLAMDGRTAVFASVLMIGTGMLFGLAPALRRPSGDLAAALRDHRRSTSLGRGTRRFRSVLIVVQVAGSLVLMLAAGLLARSLAAMQHVDPGVDPDRVAYVRPGFARSGVRDVPAALEEMRARAEALPGVTHAAVASRLPAQRSGTTSTIVDGYDPRAGDGSIEINFLVVTPQYFETVGQRLIDGRGFTASDIAGADRVVVINDAAAKRYWGGRSAVGGRLRSTARNAPFRIVVGVVEDAPVGTFPERPTRPMFYAPAAQSSLGSGYILARTDGDADRLALAMRRAVVEGRPSVGIQAHGTLASHFGAALSAPRFLTRVVGVVSFLAMLLAAVGIYAVVAFNAAHRSTEMGIRLALGATSQGLVRLIVRDTFVTVAIGLGGGIAIAALVVPRLRGLLFDVTPLDPVAFAVAVGALTAAAGLAAYMPARRAAKGDPMMSLRAE